MPSSSEKLVMVCAAELTTRILRLSAEAATAMGAFALPTSVASAPSRSRTTLFPSSSAKTASWLRFRNSTERIFPADKMRCAAPDLLYE